MTKHMTINLANGLVATTYEVDWRSKSLAKKLVKPHVDCTIDSTGTRMTLKSFRVFELKAGRKKVQFITLLHISPPPHHQEEKPPDLRDAWFIGIVREQPIKALAHHAKFIVYAKRLYKNTAPSGKTLLNAVINDISPETSALLAPANN